MPYEIGIVKAVKVASEDIYFNDCCFGGDVVSDRLLPMIRTLYQDIQANQEDWGWFIWFKHGAVSLAVDIFCDDPASGVFRLRLTSKVKRALWGSRTVDTPELDM